jgi:hypothetical protein
MGIVGRVAARIAISAALSAPALAGNGYKAYVFALETGYEAEKVCPGAKIDQTKLVFVRSAMVSDADEGAVDAEIVRMKPIIEAAVLKAGPTHWCIAASNMFGDRGLVVPGLIDFN